jgi:MFS family permease
MNVWWAVWTALFVLFAVAPGPLWLTPAAYGTLVLAMAIGGIAGSIWAGRISRLLGIKNALVLDLFGTALLVGVPAVSTDLWLVVGANVAAGTGAAIWVVLVSSIRQRLTPDPLLGRLYSASRLISWGVLPLGAGLGGLAAEVVGIRTVFAVGGVVSIVLIVAFVFLVPRRDLEPALA